MSNPISIDDQDLRKRAIKRLKRKREFWGNVSTFVLINAALWLVWALTGAHTNQEGVPWPAWISGVWALILVLQGWHLYAERPISESDIESEMNRLHRA
jgi:hypothetical protein